MDREALAHYEIRASAEHASPSFQRTCIDRLDRHGNDFGEQVKSMDHAENGIQSSVDAWLPRFSCLVSSKCTQPQPSQPHPPDARPRCDVWLRWILLHERGRVNFGEQTLHTVDTRMCMWVVSVHKHFRCFRLFLFLSSFHLFAKTWITLAFTQARKRRTRHRRALRGDTWTASHTYLIEIHVAYEKWAEKEWKHLTYITPGRGETKSTSSGMEPVHTVQLAAAARFLQRILYEPEYSRF